MFFTRLIEYVFGGLFFIFLIFFDENCAVTNELRGRDAVMNYYSEHSAVFQDAVETGDCSKAEALSGVQEVSVYDDYIEFYCGGTGIVTSSSYYGVIYTEKEIVEIFGMSSYETTVGDGEITFAQTDGDNRFIYVDLGGGFWYYEQHF